MRKIIVTIWLLLTITCSAKATVYFNDGGQHTIDYVINDAVVVDYDTPGVGTHVELISGGRLKQGITAYEDSQLTIWDGEAGGMRTWARSEVAIYGGTIESIVASIDSVVEMSGGEVIENFVMSDDSKAVVSGGVIGMNITAGKSGDTIPISLGKSGDTIPISLCTPRLFFFRVFLVVLRLPQQAW